MPPVDTSSVRSLSARRAWIEISLWVYLVGFAWSLSARRAWIEILALIIRIFMSCVALRKESVDRNFFDVSLDYKEVRSLSARRAWIEITTYFDTSSIDDCRSPQGERG